MVFFLDIKDSIHEYREKHLPFMCTISRNPSCLLNEVNKNRSPEQLMKYFPFLSAENIKNKYLTHEGDMGKKLQEITFKKMLLYGDLEDVDEASVSPLVNYMQQDFSVKLSGISTKKSKENSRKL